MIAYDYRRRVFSFSRLWHLSTSKDIDHYMRGDSTLTAVVSTGQINYSTAKTTAKYPYFSIERAERCIILMTGPFRYRRPKMVFSGIQLCYLQLTMINQFFCQPNLRVYLLSLITNKQQAVLYTVTKHAR